MTNFSNTIDTSTINLSYLELMADGDATMKKTLLDMLVDELPREVEALRQAYDAGDAEQLATVAHKLKSTLAFIGNRTMTAANAEADRIAKEGFELQRAAAHIATVERCCAEVLPAIRSASAQIAG